ncbi:unnamed protein product [Urochloa humidicola]
MTHFRPISLCNVLYKLCSKVLANRLRLILDEIISVEQSAFVPGRLITDNVLVAYECIHYLKRKKGNGACAVKLDMAKAYDRVEWQYLRAIMHKLGFSEQWIELIMRCVETVSFSVRVNGFLSEQFQPTRGIRQGDPISPYLFLLCAEGFSSLLKYTGPQFVARGVRVSIHAPWISHLMFADDCLLFTQANERGAIRLMEILDTYQRGSGQLVNVNKSAVFFSSNCLDNDKEDVKRITGVATEALGEKYLGLPTAVGRSTKDVFEHIPSKTRGLMGGWCEKKLSSAAREVLIKSKAQAIPTYSMSCFVLSPDTCKKMTSSIANYWWSSNIDRRTIHWKKWTDLTRPKSEGGMGFRELRLFNKAMLGKQGWRLMTKPDSLCAQVLKGKYFLQSDFLSANKKKNSSHTWRAILAGRDALKLGLIRRIGNGANTNIWEDKWIPGGVGMKPLCPKETATATRVEELIDHDCKCWDLAALESNLIASDVAAVARIPLGVSNEDTWAWSAERHGVYSVKSAYWLLSDREQQKRDCVLARASSSDDSNKMVWKRLWKLLKITMHTCGRF